MTAYCITMPDDEGKKYQQFRYPAGEIQVRLLEDQLEEVSAAVKIVVTAYIDDGNPMPAALLLNALFGITGKARISLILPYMPYSRADRRFTKGDCYALEVFGSCIDTWRLDEIITFDAHSDAIYDVVTARNVTAEPTIKLALGDFEEPLTILLPDKGSLTRYDKTYFEGHIVANCDKVRDPVSGKLLSFTVPRIETKRAIIIDDLCDAGGTFIGIAEEIKKLQPDVILYLYVSHGIFSKGLELLSQYFDHIWTTDSFRSKLTPDPDLKVFTRIPIGGVLKAAAMTVSEQFEEATKVQSHA